MKKVRLYVKIDRPSKKYYTSWNSTQFKPPSQRLYIGLVGDQEAP